jgi:hypothetical protein
MSTKSTPMVATMALTARLRGALAPSNGGHMPGIRMMPTLSSIPS